MIQGGDYLLKENEELGGESDHKMIILLTFYTVKVGSRVYVVCFKSTGYYIKVKPSIAGTMLGQSVKTCINALLRARGVSYDIPRSPVKQRCIKRRSLSWMKEPVCPACKTPLQLIYRRSRSQNGKTYKPKNASCFRMLICPACSPRRENTQNVH
ncbi:hypothetical protein B7P69_004987 [Escherichia coli]|nr:hypothetical protein [Escherichia coli]EIH4781550.1 hypothetical protein [Escherichia coli]